jgi:hypothetical protein
LFFDKSPSWRRNGFSPGEWELQHEHRSVKIDMLRGQKLQDLICLAKHDLYIAWVDYHKVLLYYFFFAMVLWLVQFGEYPMELI